MALASFKVCFIYGIMSSKFSHIVVCVQSPTWGLWCRMLTTFFFLFIKPSNIPLHIYSTFSFNLHLPMDTRAAFAFWLLFTLLWIYSVKSPLCTQWFCSRSLSQGLRSKCKSVFPPREWSDLVSTKLKLHVLVPLLLLWRITITKATYKKALNWILLMVSEGEPMAVMAVIVVAGRWQAWCWSGSWTSLIHKQEIEREWH